MDADLVFTEAEWNASVPKVVADMTDYLSSTGHRSSRIGVTMGWVTVADRT